MRLGIASQKIVVISFSDSEFWDFLQLAFFQILLKYFVGNAPAELPLEGSVITMNLLTCKNRVKVSRVACSWVRIAPLRWMSPTLTYASVVRRWCTNVLALPTSMLKLLLPLITLDDILAGRRSIIGCQGGGLKGGNEDSSCS